MRHPFSQDLVSVLIALLLGVPLLVLPGYCLAWLLNIFGFRDSSVNEKWSISLALGITLLPILLFQAQRNVSMKSAWLVMGLLSICGAGLAIRFRSAPALASVPRSVWCAVAIWIALGLGLTLDLRTATGLYPSNLIVDNSFRSQVISSLAQSSGGIPESFFYSPGHAEPLRYHYVYFLVPALMVQIAGGLVTSSMALLAIGLWSGLALLSVIYLAARFFFGISDPDRVLPVLFALLIVGGLDLFFAGGEMIRRLAHGLFPFTVPDVGLWNGWGAAFSWLSNALWCPHHIGGLMGGVLGCVMLWHSRVLRGRAVWSHAVAAALAFATMATSSIYVALIFAIFLLVVAVELALNVHRLVAPLLLSGALSILLVFRFLLDVAPPVSEGSPAFFGLQLRPFLPITLLYHYLGIQSRLGWNLSYLAALPLTYLFEFGLMFFAAIWWMRARDQQHDGEKYRDHLIIGLLIVSLAVPGIAWSGTQVSNDLGSRGVLPAQFLMLFCAAEFLERQRRRASSRLIQFAAVTLLVVGLCTTVLEMVLLRFGVGRDAQHSILVGEMFRTDTSSERLLQLRDAYSWIREHTPENARVQENPVTWQMVALGQYSQRRTAIYGSNPNYMVGDDHKKYFADKDAIQWLFAPGADARLENLCSRYAIDYIVAQSGDPIWSEPQSYVWTKTPVFSTALVRLLPCRT